MAVIITNMEMPERCLYCGLDEGCSYARYNSPTRPSGCPLKSADDTMLKYQQLEDFAKWVAVEVIDEELWTYNHLSFAELACRKLVRLGIMQESDGEYTYEVVEDDNT